jgi:hypothetical protein
VYYTHNDSVLHIAIPIPWQLIGPIGTPKMLSGWNAQIIQESRGYALRTALSEFCRMGAGAAQKIKNFY